MRQLFIVALALVSACSNAHVRETGDAGPAPADADSGVAPSDASLTDGGAPSRHCRELCEARRTEPTSGHCPFGTGPEGGTCEARCAEVEVTSSATREAFDWCVREDPLCFQTIDDCVYARRYPEPISAPVTLSAEGFERHDGRSVIVALASETEPTRREVVIAGGSFEVRFDERISAAWPPAVLGFVDIDGDGSCDRDTDVTFYEQLERTGTFDAPAYGAHLMGLPDRDFDFVCDSI